MVSATKRMSQSLAVLLIVAAVFSLFPLVAVQAADDVDVFYGTDRANDNEIYGVQVAASSSLSNCKICVERLREAGYNAYIFQAKKQATSYRILIGVFDRERDAEDLLNEIHNGPEVKGVKTKNAFIASAYLSERGMEDYSEPYWGTSKSTSSKSTYTAPFTPAASDEEVDVFYGTDRANDNKIYGVQVAASSSLSNCKICVERLREVGYNAYIFQAKKQATSYRILIGVFDRERDAEDLLDEIHNGPEVRGVKTKDAYIASAYLSDRGVDTYYDPYY